MRSIRAKCIKIIRLKLGLGVFTEYMHQRENPTIVGKKHPISIVQTIEFKVKRVNKRLNTIES